MALAEGRTIPFTGPEAIDASLLETFDYQGPEQEIVTESEEFSAVCPYSGLPDYARLTITYVPASCCIELKSLKYYIVSYRNVGIFQEHATARIAEDLFKALRPRRLSVKTAYQHPRRIPHHLHGRGCRNRSGQSGPEWAAMADQFRPLCPLCPLRLPSAVTLQPRTRLRHRHRRYIPLVPPRQQDRAGWPVPAPSPP